MRTVSAHALSAACGRFGGRPDPVFAARNLLVGSRHPLTVFAQNNLAQALTGRPRAYAPPVPFSSLAADRWPPLGASRRGPAPRARLLRLARARHRVATTRPERRQRTRRRTLTSPGGPSFRLAFGQGVGPPLRECFELLYPTRRSKAANRFNKTIR